MNSSQLARSRRATRWQHQTDTSSPRVMPRANSRPWVRWVTVRAFQFIVLGNALVIAWLWFHGGGVTQVHTPGQFLTSIGRLTGLYGAYLLLLQVLLLVRLPPLERLVGFDRLTVWHRLNGKVCIYLILAHAVTITLGYALMDRLSVPTEVSTLLTQYPGMVTATVGTVMLILVIVTSVVIVRRRLRYETWFLVHLLAYAGVVLAWFHQIPTGNEFSANPTVAAYWTALYLVTLAMVGLFRFAWPALRSLQFRLRVDRVIIEGPDVISLQITGRHLDRLGARAGQFFLWRFWTRNRFWESHPFSLSAAPDGQALRVTIKASGDFTRRIGEIRPGTRVLAEGPFGVFTGEARRHERVTLIAGGIGITPIRALLDELEGELVLIYRVNREEELIFRDELETLARTRGITLHFVVGDFRTPGCEHYLSAEHLRGLVPDIADHEIFLCGPPVMMAVAERGLRGAGVPSGSIHSEKFAL